MCSQDVKGEEAFRGNEALCFDIESISWYTVKRTKFKVNEICHIN